MGILEFLVVCVCVVLVTAGLIALMEYFAPSPIPPFIPKVMWGVVMLALLFVLATATGIFGHDIPIPRFR